MCDFIKPACLIANLFYTHKDKDHFALREIRRICEQVESELMDKDLNVMLVWTRPSVMSTFESYGDMFERRGSEVWKRTINEELFSDSFLEDEFNSDLPKPVKDSFLEVLERVAV